MYSIQLWKFSAILLHVFEFHNNKYTHTINCEEKAPSLNLKSPKNKCIRHQIGFNNIKTNKLIVNSKQNVLYRLHGELMVEIH